MKDNLNKKTVKMLVVEDENLLLEAITRKLQINDITAVPCACGKKAIKYLHETNEIPDAVWLDYYLKDMDGLAFIKILKKNPLLADIPVVVVSNSANPQKVKKMFALGIKEYFLKAEFRLEEIIAIVEKIVYKQ